MPSIAYRYRNKLNTKQNTRLKKYTVTKQQRNRQQKISYTHHDRQLSSSSFRFRTAIRTIAIVVVIIPTITTIVGTVSTMIGTGIPAVRIVK